MKSRRGVGEPREFVRPQLFGSDLRIDAHCADLCRVEQTAQAIAEHDVQGVRSLGQKAALLSGGNAQKAVIAREFAGNQTNILAHSPSRGLDLKATAAVHARLTEARAAGAAVLLISEDLDEV
ncbi:hypothetical protein ABTL82_18715, partial [Acinetobacter baumannii]